MHFKCVNNTLEGICNVTQSIVKMLTMFKNRRIMFRNVLVTFSNAHKMLKTKNISPCCNKADHTLSTQWTMFTCIRWIALSSFWPTKARMFVQLLVNVKLIRWIFQLAILPSLFFFSKINSPCRTRHMQNLCSMYFNTMFDYVEAISCSRCPMWWLCHMLRYIVWDM